MTIQSRIQVQWWLLEKLDKLNMGVKTIFISNHQCKKHMPVTCAPCPPLTGTGRMKCKLKNHLISESNPQKVTSSLRIHMQGSRARRKKQITEPTMCLARFLTDKAFQWRFHGKVYSQFIQFMPVYTGAGNLKTWVGCSEPFTPSPSREARKLLRHSCGRWRACFTPT